VAGEIAYVGERCDVRCWVEMAILKIHADVGLTGRRPGLYVTTVLKHPCLGEALEPSRSQAHWSRTRVVS